MFKTLVKLPMLFVVLLLGGMYLIDQLFDGYRMVVELQWLLALITFGAGVSLVTLGGQAFRKVNTTVNPIDPEKSTHLVTHGIYGFSRNPMYAGFFLWLLAWAIYLGNPISLVALPVFVVVSNRFYIAREERALRKLFGDAFAEYQGRVRRWI